MLVNLRLSLFEVSSVRSVTRALGAVTLPLRFGSLNTQTKFYVIDAETSYKALLGRPWLHENYVVPSTLHQCMKYVKDGKQRRINGDIHPFGVHEVGLSDARYYLNTPRKGIQAAQIQQSVVKKSINTPVPHWGSDTDSSSDDDVAGKANPKIDSDSDDEDRSSQTSLVVERVPERHYKDLTPREVNQIQELHVFFVPPKVEYVQGRKAVHKAILFYGIGEIPATKTFIPEMGQMAA